MNDLPEEFVRALKRLQGRLRGSDSSAIEAHALKVQEQYRMTQEQVDRVEFLLGRPLTSGEVSWLHRRLHYGLQLPADTELDYEFDTLDAAYRERLARSGGAWRGPLDDIPEQLRDLLSDE